MEKFHLPNSGHNRDDDGSKLGMWLFLFTEILLFGGLFLVYAIYRFEYFYEFKAASEHMAISLGAINTIILITSSTTVAMSITAIKKGKKKLSLILLFVTIGFALAFMVNKYFEWSAHIHHGLFPGSEVFNELTRGEGLFLYLYYFMTGLHGVHVIIGAILLAFAIRRIQKNRVDAENTVFLENGGLYWHLVDLIWIYLFPLFYLLH